MDNRVINVMSEGREAFNLAIKLAFDNAPGGKATHYVVNDKLGFVLLWHEDKGVGSVQLPVALNASTAADLIWAWLQEQPTSAYKHYLDHDGSDGHGWRVYNGPSWSHVDGCSHYAFVAVYPMWAWYGK